MLLGRCQQVQGRKTFHKIQKNRTDTQSFIVITKLFVTYMGMMRSSFPITNVLKSDKLSEISATIY